MENVFLRVDYSEKRFPCQEPKKTKKRAIPNEEMLVTRAEKSDTVGHQIQGANDDQADKDGTDN